MKNLLNRFIVSGMLAVALIVATNRGNAADETPPVKATTPVAPADTPAPAAVTPAPSRRPTPKALTYIMPKGAVGGVTERQSGGTRGGGTGLPSLVVLAPDHLALTTQAQPALFWFQSQPAKAAFQLTLTEPKKPKPLLSVNMDKAETAGIRAISLAKHGVTLEPGVEYQWHIALIPDATSRAKDLLAGSVIKRVAAPAGLEAKLDNATLAERAALYAEAGFWYDALQAISSAIAADPGNRALHDLRASLLRQAGLTEAAAAELR
jgi:hypothetical protein